jgi:ATP phosphoribosyltransferase
MTDTLVLGVPSKGRLMEDTVAFLSQAGLTLRKSGHDRGYRGFLEGIRDIEVAFLSASEIARHLRDGSVHLGVTGIDLVHEEIADFEGKVEFVRPLGFGHATVIVAVPECWIDVGELADLEEVGRNFRRASGRNMRVATKYMNITRRAFAAAGVTSYRLIESLGATEGTPAAGTAELIVDITSTGATLAANRLKVIGEILKSEATLIASRSAAWSASARRSMEQFRTRLAAVR